ncbi:MAG TPA: hypothetical protein VJ964_02175 [Balneolaceae bacterium]|nr:hypothetical protein [Balneolaceae bacterium]
MMFPGFFIYEIIALIIAIPLSYLSARLIKIIRRNQSEDDVRTLFFIYWNGKEEDEIYAWYKVRHVLLKREKENRKLQFVERKISEINKQRLYGEMSISESGELIDERQSKPKMH